MLNNSRNTVIQGKAKVVNAAGDSYICDHVVNHNSRPSPRYISPPIAFKFPRWKNTHKLERAEMRLEIMIESLKEYRSVTAPREYGWCVQKCKEYNKQTEKLLELAESKSFLNLDFNSEVARHVSMVKRLRKRVEKVTRAGLIMQLEDAGEPQHLCQECSSKISESELGGQCATMTPIRRVITR